AAHRPPLQGMLLYLLVGVVWVAATDAILTRWVADPDLLARLHTWKGWVYVVITSLLALVLLRRVGRSEWRQSAVARELAQVMRHTPAGIARVALDGRIQWANERLCELLAVSLDELVTMNI